MNSTWSKIGRIFLLVGVAAALVAIVALVEKQPAEERPAEAQTGERPNIVFVMTDDLNERDMDDLGGIRDVMSSNGTTFDNAYVTYSLCCPSRATFLRGQYPHNHGVIGLDNANPPSGEKKFRSLGRDQSTVATWLDEADYQTKYIGKYSNGYGYNGDLYVPLGWDEWFVLRGDASTSSQVSDDGQAVTIEGHSTDVFANEASDFIRRSSVNLQPFFVVVGTKAPHGPPEVADRYQGSFADTPLPQPPNFNEQDVSDKPAWVQSYPLNGPIGTDNMQQEYRNRLRSMLSVEDLLRQIISTLKDSGELENTYIFFTSDNGLHLGNHRLNQKKKTPYEETISVPLIVRGPGVPAGAVRQELVINNDLAPTIADLAGASTPSFVDGRSFAPLLTGSPPTSWRQAFLEEGWGVEGGTQVRTPTHKGVHTKDHMFVEYDTGERELYDLDADPYQLNSLPRVGNEQTYSSLETRLNNLRDCSGATCRDAEWTTAAPPPANCTIRGTSGNDVLNGTSGNDVICGAGGSDTIKGIGGNDILRGEAGNDQLFGGAGDDTLDGSTGTDVANFSEALAAITASLTANTATGDGSDALAGVEKLVGSSKNDALTGSDGTNTINGGGGADTLDGLGGADTLTGGGGNDTEHGGLENDTVVGSGGADSLFGDENDDAVNSEDGVNGNDSLDGGGGTDTKVTDTTEKSIVGFP